jgi:hypothetical protein
MISLEDAAHGLGVETTVFHCMLGGTQEGFLPVGIGQTPQGAQVNGASTFMRYAIPSRKPASYGKRFRKSSSMRVPVAPVSRRGRVA